MILNHSNEKTNQRIRHRDVTGFIWLVEDDGGEAQRKKSHQRIERDEFYPVKTKNHVYPWLVERGADIVCFFQLILECSRFLPVASLPITYRPLNFLFLSFFLFPRKKIFFRDLLQDPPPHITSLFLSSHLPLSSSSVSSSLYFLFIYLFIFEILLLFPKTIFFFFFF